VAYSEVASISADSAAIYGAVATGNPKWHKLLGVKLQSAFKSKSELGNALQKATSRL
jgi:hypothetical protein